MRITPGRNLNASLAFFTDTHVMAQVIALARNVEFSAIDALRTVIVTGCAAALIMAGPFFPALGF